MGAHQQTLMAQKIAASGPSWTQRAQDLFPTGSLSANWTADGNINNTSISCVSNAAQISGTGALYNVQVYTGYGSWTATQRSDVTITGTVGASYVHDALCNYDRTTGNGWVGEASDYYYIVRFDGYTPTTLATSAFAPVAGDVMSLRHDTTNNTVTLWVNGVQALSVSSTAYETTNPPGFALSVTSGTITVRIDDWTGYDAP